MNVPDDLLYTETHEWIKREGENVRIGVTDHAQSELTDVVYVELPKVDRQANAKEAIAVVESVKAASDIYAPVKGTVVEINKALEADPGLINREPYGQGWIFILKTSTRRSRSAVAARAARARKPGTVGARARSEALRRKSRRVCMGTPISFRRTGGVVLQKCQPPHPL